MSPALRSAMHRLSPVHHYVVLAADVARLADAPSRADFSRLLSPAERGAGLDLSRETDDERRLMEERARYGHWCIGGRVDGVLAFYAWLMFGEMELGDRVVPIPSVYAYSYKVFVARPFRRHGLASAYYAFLGGELSTLPPVPVTAASDGYADASGESVHVRLLATVSADNDPSLRLHQRCGFAAVGALWTARAGGVEHVIAAHGPSWLTTPPRPSFMAA